MTELSHVKVAHDDLKPNMTIYMYIKQRSFYTIYLKPILINIFPHCIKYNLYVYFPTYRGTYLLCMA